MRAPAPASVASVAPAASLDLESRAWIDALGDEGAVRDDAVARLHALLLRAARFEVARRRPALPHLRGNELDDIALEAADDALVSVLARLEDFEGRSRFSTWAYKFALLEAAVKLRKRSWQGREIPLEPESWSLRAPPPASPEHPAQQGEHHRTNTEGIESERTPPPPRVLVAIALNGVPIDVLAERLGSTRGALYKTLHDGRQKLRAHLASQGLAVDPAEGGNRHG